MQVKFFSTNQSAPAVSLEEALLAGQAPDRGLYLPEIVPPYSAVLLRRASQLSYAELAQALLAPYTEGCFSAAELAGICQQAYDFEVPLEPAAEARWVLRLDRGPTASFKDFAARFMGLAIGALVARRGHKLTILTATSGDTGSAVGRAFAGVEGIEVVILYPKGEVSARQQAQMTAIGGNVRVIEVAGKFDDCQALVKEAFADPRLEDLRLSSANSINIGRLLPQSVYYVYAASRVIELDPAAGQALVFAVPSGNFGDLMGGMLAQRAGLPVAKFVVGTNANDEFPRFLDSGRYQAVVPSRHCLSNAMNVGHPSNLARLVALYGGQMDQHGHLSQAPDMDLMRRELYATSVSDGATKATIRAAYQEDELLLEPHGAVAWEALTRYRRAHGCRLPAIALETAHPAKFPEAIRECLGIEPELPGSLQFAEIPPPHAQLEADYDCFFEYLHSQA